MTRSGYTFERTAYGYKLTQWGEFSLGEVRDLRDDVLSRLAEQQGPFSVLVDVRSVVPPTEGDLKVYGPMFQRMLQLGCRRFALMAKSPVVRAMAQRLCAIPEAESIARVFDTWNVPDCEHQALAWLNPSATPAPTE